AARGARRPEAEEEVSAAIDRWVYYAGWTDKVAQVVGGANPVSGPYHNHSVPEPTGVVAVLAPQDAPLLGLVSVLAPVIATGNTAVLVAAERAPLPAVALAEALATSDLPGGVVNLLTGRTAELAPHLAAHADVNALDLAGAGDLAAELEAAAADTLKRVLRPRQAPDWSADPGLSRITPFLETKTVWHPVGLQNRTQPARTGRPGAAARPGGGGPAPHDRPPNRPRRRRPAPLWDRAAPAGPPRTPHRAGPRRGRRTPPRPGAAPLRRPGRRHPAQGRRRHRPGPVRGAERRRGGRLRHPRHLGPLRVRRGPRHRDHRQPGERGAAPLLPHRPGAPGPGHRPHRLHPARPAGPRGGAGRPG